MPTLSRRTFLGTAALLAGGSATNAFAHRPQDRVKDLKIHDVREIITQPTTQLIVVKVETTEPELYGLGCATFAYHLTAVAAAVNDFLRPFLKGKNPGDIEDIWQSCFVSAYWRNGPVLGNALSGVDMALWDIKVKLAGMPVYELFGGKAREAAICEAFGVRTAWHGPGDVSPVGHAANLHLNLNTWNFGIQESAALLVDDDHPLREIFPGMPEVRDGYVWCNDRPGLGVDLDEAAAAKFPLKDFSSAAWKWGNVRRPDGTIVRP